jgi:preprotein translocase subunit SecF
VVIQLEADEARPGAEVRDRVLQVLEGIDPAVDLRRVEFVGPQVGEELAEAGGLATLFALLMILAYVAFRFQWKFAVGAVVALIHDVIITLGFFSLTYLAFDLSVLAAVLAVIGYSLNDTIVVFDRIRENLLRVRKTATEEVINLSINQMLARTLMTSGTTLLVLLALFLLGGEAIYGFSVALIVGIVVGTYSSIYVASPTAIALELTAADLLPAEKDTGELDQLP